MVVYLGFLGAAMGSFVDALVWRLRTGRGLGGRSECESCHHRLGFADLVPVFSWVFLRGKCRHCGAKINPLVPVIEIALVALFVISAWSWGSGTPSLALWLVYLPVLAALAVYDARWGELPDVLVLPLVPLALVDAALRVDPLTATAYVAHVLPGAALLGGLYAVLFAVSRGRWVGLGDAKLGLFAGIVLGWRHGLLALAVANALGAIVALALRRRRIALGPFLVAGFVVAGLTASG